jgi:hypothetical protein
MEIRAEAVYGEERMIHGHWARLWLDPLMERSLEASRRP